MTFDIQEGTFLLETFLSLIFAFYLFSLKMMGWIAKKPNIVKMLNPEGLIIV